jgi:pyruvate,water dikinase
MAVLVQAMVSARASGVMFTANPITGDHDEIVINVNPGLGTVVVAGQVTPDTYRLNKTTLRVRERDVAEKVEMVVAEDEGTRLVPVPERQRRKSTLSRRQCSELGRLGRRIESHFGSPQDIEFVHDGERFWIVQSRPVTGLVSWGKPTKGTAWSRHSFMAFTPRPLSPLFETTYLPIMGDSLRTLAGEFGIVSRGKQPVIVTLNGPVAARSCGSTGPWP